MADKAVVELRRRVIEKLSNYGLHTAGDASLVDLIISFVVNHRSTEAMRSELSRYLDDKTCEFVEWIRSETQTSRTQHLHRQDRTLHERRTKDKADNKASVFKMEDQIQRIVSLCSGADDSPSMFDLEKEKTIENWSMLLKPAIKRALSQVHQSGGFDATAEALDQLQHLCIQLLKQTVGGTVREVRARVQQLFQSPLDRFAISRADDELVKAASYLFSHETTRSEPMVLTTRQSVVSKLRGNRYKTRQSSTVSATALAASFGSYLGQQLAGLDLSDIDQPPLVVVFLLAVLEYMATDILKLTAKYVENMNKTCITDEDIRISMYVDPAIFRIFFGGDDDEDNDHSELFQPGDIISPMIACGLEDLDTMSIHKRRTAGALSSSVTATSIQTYDATIREMISAEKAYIGHLQLLIKVFRDPIVKLLPTDLLMNGEKQEDSRLESVFSNIDEIYDLAVTLVGSLEDTLEAAQENEAPQIGLALEELVETGDFDSYFRYTEDIIYNSDNDEFFSSRSNLLHILSQEGVLESLKKAGHGKQFHLAVKYMLPKLLIWPVCHCFQYFEYLKLFLQLTPSDDDRESFRQAEAILKPLKSRLEDLVSKISTCNSLSQSSTMGSTMTLVPSASQSFNASALSQSGSCKRLKLSDLVLRLHRPANRMEAKMKISEVQKSVEGLKLHQLCQDFITEGPLKQSTKGRLSDRYAYLFDGQLILCKPKEPNAGSKRVSVATNASGNSQIEYKLKEKLYVATIELNDMDTDNSCQSPSHNHHYHQHSSSSDLSDAISIINGGMPVSPSRHTHTFSGINSSATASGIQSASSILAGASGHCSDTVSVASSSAPLNPLNSLISSGTFTFSLNNNNSKVSSHPHGFEINRPQKDGGKIILYANSADEKMNWMAHLVRLSTRTMLDRTLESILAEEEKRHPLQLPPSDLYCFSEADSPDNIAFEEKDKSSDGAPLIKGATLVKLVERLTYHQHAQPSFVRTFLVTYRSFCSPEELLDLLIQRFAIPEPSIERLYPEKASMGENGEYSEHVRNLYREDLKKFRKQYAQPVRFRVVNVIKQWVTDHFYDFERNCSLLEKLTCFLERDVKNCQSVKMSKWVDPLIRVIGKKKAQLNFHQGGPIAWNPSACENPSEPHALSTGQTFYPQRPPLERFIELSNELGMNILTVHPIEMGRQLTLMQFDLFRALRPAEMVDAAWTKEGMEQAPNLLRLMHDSTNFTYWIEKTIVEVENFEERVAIMTRFLEILYVFIDLNNFHGIMALMSALNSASVHRLEYTRNAALKNNKLLSGAWKEGRDICDRANNFKYLKDKLKSINPPCVPFCGMYLTYLVAINDGNPDYISSFSTKELSNGTNFGHRFGIESPTGTDTLPGDGELSPTDTQATVTSFASMQSVSTIKSSSSTLTDGTMTIYSDDNVHIDRVAQSSDGNMQDTMHSVEPALRVGQLINFNKRRKVADIIAEIQQYQNQPYHLTREENIASWLRRETGVLHDINKEGPTDSVAISAKEKMLNDHFYNKSLEIEPRPKTGEKRPGPPNFPRKYPQIPQHKLRGQLKGTRSSRSLTNPGPLDSIRNSLSIGNIDEHGHVASAGPTHSPSTPLTPPHSAASFSGCSDQSVFANVFIGGGPSTPLNSTPPTPGVFSSVTVPQHGLPPPPLPHSSSSAVTPPILPPRTHRSQRLSNTSNASSISPQSRQAPDAPLLPPKADADPTRSPPLPPPIPPRISGTLPRSRVANANVHTESTHFRFFPPANTAPGPQSISGRRNSSNDFMHESCASSGPCTEKATLAGPLQAPSSIHRPILPERRQSSNSASSTPPLSPASGPVLPPKTYKTSLPPLSSNGTIN